MRHHPKFVVCLVAVVALLFACSGIALSQEITGSIVGTVKDANGASIKGAAVTITNSDTKLVVRTVTTNDDGEFSVPLLPVGSYDVAVEAPNFKKHVDERVKPLRPGKHPAHAVWTEIMAGGAMRYYNMR